VNVKDKNPTGIMPPQRCPQAIPSIILQQLSYYFPGLLENARIDKIKKQYIIYS
jgi:hypothetical protein